MKLKIDAAFIQARKKQIQANPEISGFLGGIFLATGLLFCFWGPVAGAFHEALSNERHLVYESFSLPLAKALASGDDLTWVDELRRLQKVPGIVSAKILQKDETGRGFSLIWEGKKVGELEVQLSKVHLRKWHYHCLERGWSLVLLFGLLGAVAGWGYRRARRQMLKRLVTLSKLRHKNHIHHLRRLKETTVNDLTEWSRQAMRLSPYGLILLDAGQRVVSFNSKAQEMLKLEAGTIGTHWMEIYQSPEWAAALCQTLERPGERVIPFTSESLRGYSLFTFIKEDKSISATWIVVHSAAFVPEVRRLAAAV